MAKAQFSDPNLLLRVQDLLSRKPNFYDVAFAVGPKKTEVKAVRILLEAASPVLEKEFERWEATVLSGVHGGRIPLPDFEPVAFEVFVKQTMLDDWSRDAMRNLKLRPDQVLNLIVICRAYKIESALTILHEMMKWFYRNLFVDYKMSEDFLRLSHANVLTIFSSDYPPIKEIEMFECACRWAKAECARKKIKDSPENIRLVLGDILFEIRFPLMSTKEFNQCVQYCDVLTPTEGFEVFKFISDNGNPAFDVDVSNLPFKTRKRGIPIQPEVEMPKFSTLRLSMHSAIVDNPPFVCDGQEHYIDMETVRPIIIYGLGFLGPINKDATYDVTIRFQNYKGLRKGESFFPGTIERRVEAQKGKVFRVMFDQPIPLDKGSMDTWMNYYGIYHSLKGPNTKSFRRKFGTPGICFKNVEGNEFRFWWESNQLAEILYTNA